MKKFIGIISALIYLISANSLVHASTMGFFYSHQNMSTTNHCNTTHDSNQDKNQNNIDCCELVYSNEYFISQIHFKNFQKNYFSLVLPNTNEICNKQDIIINKPLLTQSPPGRKTDNKYNNFSDLAGIIVNLI